ncbi:MAG: CRTAC1 family protein, partial [Bacteroidia bacterium]|nr:CRTAC1 family protein [Bacteroidia bacterium]
MTSSFAFSQYFNRVENVSGLGFLEENNGASVADYDGDNDLDIFVVAKSIDQQGIEKTKSKLFKNNNDGTFEDVTEQSGLLGILTENEQTLDNSALDGFKYGAFWGDYNNDGFPDILLTYSLKIQLFQNLGNGTFQDVTESSGIQSFNNCITPSATWFDYNNDGFLDIYITIWGECESARLYENNGNGTFLDVTNKIEIADTQHLYLAYPFDFNSDGWMDLYITNDLDSSNPLLINQNGNQFFDDAVSYGMEINENDMGLSIGDYNGDGYFDFYVTNINENYLLTNDGYNTFFDVAEEKNVKDVGLAWDTKFVDFDLDGDEDLFVVNGYDFAFTDEEYNSYFKNLLIEGQEEFEEISEDTNLRDLTISVSAVDFDFDNDGDIDIFVTNSDRHSYFYENTTLNFNETNSLNWFKVILQGTQSNRDAIGTELTLTTENGSIKRYYTGVGFLGQSLTPVHFGLNEVTNILELSIKWPSGLIDTYQNLNSNSIIKAIEGQGYEVLDIQPSIKVSGCTDPSSCNYNPNAYIDDGSCTYFQGHEIVGTTNSSFLNEEIYSYPLSENSISQWSVNGGEIVDGQGTNEVRVKWGLEEIGIISIIEVTPDCSSSLVSLEVELTIDNVDFNKSIARLWNEALLEAIRGDFARPTVHARNLFHTSVAMYDAWAIYSDQAAPYLVGNEINSFSSTLVNFEPEEGIVESRKKAISYAAYRLLSHRFKDSPSAEKSLAKFNFIMSQLGYDVLLNRIDYENGNAAALGNFIAKTIIDYGTLDGAREETGYDNAYYTPVNSPLAPIIPGNPNLSDPNRWQ